MTSRHIYISPAQIGFHASFIFLFSVKSFGFPPGSLPDWLQGTLVRNGPGLFTIGETSYNHWFDGLALMHNFVIKNGNCLPPESSHLCFYLHFLFGLGFTNEPLKM